MWRGCRRPPRYSGSLSVVHPLRWGLGSASPLRDRTQSWEIRALVLPVSTHLAHSPDLKSGCWNCARCWPDSFWNRPVFTETEMPNKWLQNRKNNIKNLVTVGSIKIGNCNLYQRKSGPTRNSNSYFLPCTYIKPSGHWQNDSSSEPILVWGD